MKSFLSSAKGESVLGIDIGSSAIKVVQLKNKGGTAVLETYGEIALGPYGNTEIGRATNLPPEKITEALSDVIREANVTAKSAALSIPFSASLISVIKMPAVARKQLSTMVPIEARKYIPVPIAEVALDWFEIPEEERIETLGANEAPAAPAVPSGSIDVLLVAIHNDVIGKYQKIVQDAGLPPSLLEIEVFSTVRAVLEHGIAPLAIMDLGAATSKLYIVEHGVVRESHIINRGAQDVTLTISKALGFSVARAEELKRKYGIAGSTEPDAAKLKDISRISLDFMFSEANRVLLSYQNKRRKNVSKVFLTGGGASLKGLLPLAQEKLSIEVVLGDPFGKTETPAFLEGTLKEAGPEFAVAVGLALRKLQESA